MNLVAIKGMEMPSSCLTCDMTREDRQLRDRCAFTYEDVGYEIWKGLKHPNCPLVEVNIESEEH